MEISLWRRWFVILLTYKSDSCLLCIPAERSRGDRDLVVSHPLMAEIDRLQMIVDNVEGKIRAVNRQGEGALIANLIDTEHLKKIILDTRRDLQSKASQRITALGQMGCGKSTTLNMILCSSILEIDEYKRVWSEVYDSCVEGKVPDVLTVQFFADSVRIGIVSLLI